MVLLLLGLGMLEILTQWKREEVRFCMSTWFEVTVANCPICVM